MEVKMISNVLGIEVYEVRGDDEVIYKEIDREFHTIRWYEDPTCLNRVSAPYWAHH